MFPIHMKAYTGKMYLTLLNGFNALMIYDNSNLLAMCTTNIMVK